MNGDLFCLKDAVISPDGIYRYRLSRTWDLSKLPLPWIMLNPSRADAEIDDPTIRRCCSFAKREGAGGIEIMNLFAYRATEPKALKLALDPVGPDNDAWIREVLYPHSRVVIAWGAHGSLRNRDADVLRMLINHIDVYALGWTVKGCPMHPLYLAGDRPLVKLDTARAA